MTWQSWLFRTIAAAWDASGVPAAAQLHYQPMCQKYTAYRMHPSRLLFEITTSAATVEFCAYDPLTVACLRSVSNRQIDVLPVVQLQAGPPPYSFARLKTLSSY